MNAYHESAAKQFARDVASHKIEIVRDDGLYRHVKFRGPRNFFWFDLVTWPGSLVIHGDSGTYVFNRISDMFGFFREPKINPSYWAEKCISVARNGGVDQFTADAFRHAVLACMASFLGLDDVSEIPKPAVHRLEREVIADSYSVEDAGNAARRFEYCGYYPLKDIHEYDVTDYTPSFLWCLHAIRWGVERYDAEKAHVIGGYL